MQPAKDQHYPLQETYVPGFSYHEPQFKDQRHKREVGSWHVSTVSLKPAYSIQASRLCREGVRSLGQMPVSLCEEVNLGHVAPKGTN